MIHLRVNIWSLVEYDLRKPACSEPIRLLSSTKVVNLSFIRLVNNFPKQLNIVMPL